MASNLTREKNSRETISLQFPAIRGIQAGKEYYITMFPLNLIPRLFLFDESEVPPKLRAQRVLNYARIPAIANYIVNNPTDYVFSSITASIDGNVDFLPYAEKGQFNKVGVLAIPLSARFVINDGQHRRAAIEAALKARPEIGHETISVVLFLDTGLKKSQQMFADLNKHAVPPTKSLGILYDSRDPFARLAVDLAASVPIFKGLTDFEKTTISNRSIKMFTLSSIYQATKELIGKPSTAKKIAKNDQELAHDYWCEVAKNIPEWRLVIDRRVNSSELRRDYVHAHGVILHALGIAGRALMEAYPLEWKQQLEKLNEIDWSRSNVALWEGRAMIGGRINKSQTNLMLTTNALKTILGVTLTPEEERIEALFTRVG
ncbi:MAG: DNA sulfur modification protein DndB [Halobacteriota archaeon]|jgi:DNA sulfur modification protein DndB